MICSAASLGAGLGFFCHAFSQSVLADPQRYATATADLYTRLAELAVVAASDNVTISVEQMYSPHQIPWTVSGSQQLLQDVYKLHQAPLYLTLDTGHQIGQRRHLTPQPADIQAYVTAVNNGQRPPAVWLGPVLFGDDAKLTVDGLTEYVQERPYLFATDADAICIIGCGHWVVTHPSSICNKPMAAPRHIVPSRMPPTAPASLIRSKVLTAIRDLCNSRHQLSTALHRSIPDAGSVQWNRRTSCPNSRQHPRVGGLLASVHPAGRIAVGYPSRLTLTASQNSHRLLVMGFIGRFSNT